LNESLKNEPAPRKKPSIKSIASMVLFLALIVWLGVYIWENRAEMTQMLQLSWPLIAGMLLLALGTCLVNCLYHLVILRTFSLPLTLTDWMGVVFVSNSMAYVLPMRADLVFTATYYKRAKGLAYTKSVSMVAGNIVFGVAFSLLQIFVALLCIGLLDGEWPGTLWVLLILGTAILTVFIVLTLFFQNRMPAFLQKVKIVTDVTEGFVSLLRNKAMLWQLLGCMIGGNLFRLLLYMVCFHTIGQPVTFYESLFFSSVSWLASVVAIVPGNIGIAEGAMGVAALLLGRFSDVAMTAVSLLHRVAIMVIYLAVGAVFAIPVYRRFTGRKAVSCELEDEG